MLYMPQKLKWGVFWAGVLCFEVLFINLGLWQYHRMHEKQALKQAFIESLPERTKTYTGVFDEARQVVLESQRYRNLYGYRILTPLVMGNVEIIVDRGWIPRSHEAGFLAQYRANTHKVSGILRTPPERKQIWFKGSDYGQQGGKHAATIINVLDLSLIAQAKGVERLPLYLQATTPTNPKAKAFFDPPQGGEKHQEYMLTWAALALILPVMAGLLFRQRKAEKQAV